MAQFFFNKNVFHLKVYLLNKWKNGNLWNFIRNLMAESIEKERTKEFLLNLGYGTTKHV